MSQGRPASSAEPTSSRQVFLDVAASDEYQRLRSRFRNFAFPMTIAGLSAYLVFVILSIYAVDFMSTPFLGLQGINVGLVIGIAQFVIVWVWTAIYVNYSNNKLDPLANEIKERLVNEGAV